MNSRIDIGGVISRTFEIYADQIPVLIPTSAVVFVITGILSEVLVAASSGLVLVSFLLDLVATSLFTGIVVGLVADIQDGRRDASVEQLLRAVTPVLGQLILVGIVAAVAQGVGFLLLIIPGAILVTYWAVFAPVVVLERPPGLKALGRSRELVRGNAWRVFAVVLFFFILVVVVGGGFEVAADAASAAAGLIVRVLVGVLGSPLIALAAAVLYFDLRRAHGAQQSLGAQPPGTTLADLALSPIDATQLLRPGLLEGVSLLSAEAPRAPATRNFGAAVGEACAALGARVYRCCPLCDRSRCEDRAGLEEGADEGVAVDRAAIEQGLASALEGGRSLDLLAVDAAGLFAEALASGADPQAALRLCMAGAWETTRALLGGVQSDAAGEEPRGERSGKTAAPGGRIVYIAPPADAGELAGGAQAGLENLARTLSVEWARYAITVVAIIPGERTSASEAAALTAYLGSRAGAYFSGCVFDLRGA